MMGYFFQFISILCFGISNCLWKIPSKTQPTIKVIMAKAILTSGIFGVLFFISYFPQIQPNCSILDYGLLNTLTAHTDYSPLNICIAIFLSAFSYFGLYFYNQSLKITKVSLSASVVSFTSLFSVATAILFFGESFKFEFLISLALGIVGLKLIGSKNLVGFFTFSINPKDNKGILFAILAAFFWGVTFSLFKLPIQKLGPLLFSFILEFTVLLMSLFHFRFTKKADEPFMPNFTVPIFFIALCGIGGVLFHNIAMRTSVVSILGIMSVLTPVVSTVFAYLYFKEKMNWNHYLGIFLIIAAILLLKF